jgi:hypothetical protein
MDRRRALRTIFCFSTLAAVRPLRAASIAKPASHAHHILAIGDYGTTGKEQRKVSDAMAAFMQRESISPREMLLLGDNFYSPAKDGFSVDSERWRTTFEDVYPASSFAMPCWAILGNHDYHDNAGGEKIQIEYARAKKTRWNMPAKWYRLELGPDESKPWATVLALDSNLPQVSSGTSTKPRASLTEEESKQQFAWMESELQKPRAPITIVLGHHPLYSNGDHGDTEALVQEWEPLFEKYKVHAYLCGHDHDMQHLEFEGRFTSHILSGGGGAKIRALKKDRNMPFAESVYGFSHLELFPDALRVAHYNADGNPLHQFTKHPDGSFKVS